ncbi:hypothetical protein [Metabacillus litoralis]|uniref:hypothetical protein n=1 Tax=Metabacillus litoralis TaxID=152268 RepID=UPI000EF5AC65|nr:hypothetical protein [Metabacillus litoralis]
MAFNNNKLVSIYVINELITSDIPDIKQIETDYNSLYIKTKSLFGEPKDGIDGSGLSPSPLFFQRHNWIKNDPFEQLSIKISSSEWEPGNSYMTAYSISLKNYKF